MKNNVLHCLVSFYLILNNLSALCDKLKLNEVSVNEEF